MPRQLMSEGAGGGSDERGDAAAVCDPAVEGVTASGCTGATSTGPGEMKKLTAEEALYTGRGYLALRIAGAVGGGDEGALLDDQPEERGALGLRSSAQSMLSGRSGTANAGGASATTQPDALANVNPDQATVGEDDLAGGVSALDQKNYTQALSLRAWGWRRTMRMRELHEAAKCRSAGGAGVQYDQAVEERLRRRRRCRRTT